VITLAAREARRLHWATSRVPGGRELGVFGGITVKPVRSTSFAFIVSLLCTGVGIACSGSSSSTPQVTGANGATGHDSGSVASEGETGTGTGSSSGTNTGTGTGDDASADSGPGLQLEAIDDMATNSGSILPSHGRVGAWYTYNDATAGATEMPGVPFTKTALNPPRDTANFAARMQGSGFTLWGAGEGFNLDDPGNGEGGSAKIAYDASAYTGIAFWAKAGSGSTTSLRVNVSDKDTDPAGGVCMPVSKCNDHFGATLPLSTQWRQFVLPFSELKQAGWGMPAPSFDPAHLYACQFQVVAGATFDIWIADIYFVLP
jgi:hypothetical protein